MTDRSTGQKNVEGEEQKLPMNPRFPDYDPNEALESWVEHESEGNADRAKILRERALTEPILRNFFINGPTALTYGGLTSLNENASDRQL
jgi:hypothetical protein